MSNLSPKAEPIVWYTIGGLLAGAIVDYLGITPDSNLWQLLTYVIPLVVANLGARLMVWAPDTHEAAVKDALNRQATDPGEWGAGLP